MKLNRAMWVVMASMVLAISTWTKAAEDEGRPAEFKVLDRWVGDWDLEITAKGLAVPGGSKSTYKSTNRWAINNRFLIGESIGEGVSGDKKFADSFMWVVTYDMQKGAYTDHVFWCNLEAGAAGVWGTTAKSVGTWDEKAQTMTTRSEDAEQGTLTIAVTQWIDKDTHRFVQSITDKGGRVVIEMTGTARRRK